MKKLVRGAIGAVLALTLAVPTSSPAAAATIAPPLLFGVSTTLTPGSLSRIGEIEAATATRVGIVQWFQSFPSALLAERAKLVTASGRIPLITWQPGVTGQGVNQPAYTLASIANGAHDAYLRSWGQSLAAIKGPVWLRFAPEMNGDWLPWSEGVNGNATGSFVRAWRHVHDVVTAAGATNVVWMWCPNVPYNGATPLPGLYPGDAYADLVGLDGYNFGTTKPTGWRGYHQIFDRGLAELRALTKREIVIAEIGSVEQGSSKADWVVNFLRAVDADSRIKAVVWFDIKDGIRDYRIASSAASAKAFRVTLPALNRRPVATPAGGAVRIARR
jgi:hypothetical protein